MFEVTCCIWIKITITRLAQMISQEFHFIAHGKLPSYMKQEGNTKSGKENQQVFKT